MVSVDYIQDQQLDRLQRLLLETLGKSPPAPAVATPAPIQPVARQQPPVRSGPLLPHEVLQAVFRR